MYSRKKEDPPCDGCLPPLNPENEDAIRVYSLTRDQLIFAGMSGTPVGINQLAVWRVIDELDIPASDRVSVFEKVLVLVQQDIKRMQMKMEGSKTSARPVAPRRR